MDISVIAVFIEGLLSFFSPCVLPLLPIYIGYLSGGTRQTLEDGTVIYDKKKVLVNTIFFVIGISMAFFLLGLGISAVGKFFSGNQLLFARIGGVIVILFGLYQMGLFGNLKFMSGNHRLPISFEKMTMSPITALIMGFVLSFAWSPCVGPVLSSVLIMASSATSSGAGFLLIGVYTLGYIIPFIFVGIFTTKLLDLFRKHNNVVKYTVKIGGALLIVMGVLMITGKMNTITGILSSNVNQTTEAESNGATQADNSQNTDGKQGVDDSTNQESDNKNDSKNANENDNKNADKNDSENKNEMAAPDFELVDQYGQTHKLSEYKGKVVFLNFWATWCPPCKAELPYIQQLYEEYAAIENPDVVILGVTFPGYGNEQDEDGVKEFLRQNGYTFPVLMDEEASLMMPYYISAYPTTYLIDAEGNIFGYVPGGMTKKMMEDVITQCKNGKK